MIKTAYLLVLLMAVLHGPAMASPLRLSTIDTPPWAYMDPATGQPTGVFPAVVRELERRTGIDIAMSLTPFARIGPELASGEQDGTIIVWLASHDAFALKGEEVSGHIMGVIPRKGVALTGYEALHGLTVSVLRGLKIGEPFDSDPAIVRIPDTDYRTGVRKTAFGRVDAVAGALATIEHVAREDGLAPRLGEPLELSTMSIVLQFSKKSPRMNDFHTLNQAIRDMRRDGTIERIKKHFYFR